MSNLELTVMVSVHVYELGKSDAMSNGRVDSRAIASCGPREALQRFCV